MTRDRQHRLTLGRLVMGGLMACLVAIGAHPAFALLAGKDPFPDLVAVSDAELGSMRGGFNFHGVDINFGIQGVTYVNGSLTAQYDFTTNSLFNKIQVGDNNFAPESINFDGVLNLIQVTQDNTVVQHLSNITIDVMNSQFQQFNSLSSNVMSSITQMLTRR